MKHSLCLGTPQQINLSINLLELNRELKGMTKVKSGERIEALAATALGEHFLGWKLISKNYRKRVGEIDLIYEDPVALEMIFVEVRARTSLNSNSNMESGIQSISPTKLRRLHLTIQSFLQKYRGRATRCRLDVLDWNGEYFLHYRNIWK